MLLALAFSLVSFFAPEEASTSPSPNPSRNLDKGSEPWGSLAEERKTLAHEDSCNSSPETEGMEPFYKYHRQGLGKQRDLW